MSKRIQELIVLFKSTGTGTLSPQPPSESRRHIQSLEHLAAHQIPAEYAQWLEEFDGATIHTVNVFGLRGSGKLFDQQSDYLNQGWLNIANDGCGNYYVMALDGRFHLPCPILFVDSYAELDDAFIVASDFCSFLQGLLANAEGQFHWPFDKKTTLQLDPELAFAKNVRFPWDSESTT